MENIYEAVHVHSADAKLVIEEYRQKGYILLERTKPTIQAQMGFVRLVFVPSENAVVQPPPKAYWG